MTGEEEQRFKNISNWKKYPDDNTVRVYRTDRHNVLSVTFKSKPNGKRYTVIKEVESRMELSTIRYTNLLKANGDPLSEWRPIVSETAFLADPRRFMIINMKDDPADYTLFNELNIDKFKSCYYIEFINCTSNLNQLLSCRYPIGLEIIIVRGGRMSFDDTIVHPLKYRLRRFGFLLLEHMPNASGLLRYFADLDEAYVSDPLHLPLHATVIVQADVDEGTNEIVYSGFQITDAFIEAVNASRCLSVQVRIDTPHDAYMAMKMYMTCKYLCPAQANSDMLTGEDQALLKRVSTWIGVYGRHYEGVKIPKPNALFDLDEKIFRGKTPIEPERIHPSLLDQMENLRATN
jgi:hypothetical protein